MNWINNVVRPKIRSFLQKKETPENLWVKCPESGEMVSYRDLEANQWVVPNSGYHMKIKSTDRLATFLDGGQYETVPLPSAPQDPLKFRDTKRYTDRLKESRTKTGNDDAVMVVTGKLYGNPVTVAVQDFDFMAGNLHALALHPRGEHCCGGSSRNLFQRLSTAIASAQLFRVETQIRDRPFGRSCLMITALYE